MLLLKSPLLNPRSQRFAPMFSSKIFVVLALTFRSLTHSELIFADEDPILFFCFNYRVVPNNLLKRLFPSLLLIHFLIDA